LNNIIKISAITGGINEPSARFRVRQYVEELKKFDVQVVEHIPFIAKSGKYWYHNYSLPVQTIPQLTAAALRLVSRVPALFNSYQTDITWIQREFLTAFATLECLSKRPRIFDIDDAIWLRLNITSGFAKAIVRNMDGLICGNDWIADYFSDCNVPTWIVPTAIDTEKWKPESDIDTNNNRKDLIIGWIGTSGNYDYLYYIEKSLEIFFKKFNNAKLLIVSDSKPNFSCLSSKYIHFEKWSKENEVQLVQKMDIGIMPLKNSDWEKGKCSFKMLLYMAAGIPVVVSPVGMNKEVLEKGFVGFEAMNTSDWVDALTTLCCDTNLRKRVGKTGRKIAIKNYSVKSVTPLLLNIFHKFIK